MKMTALTARLAPPVAPAVRSTAAGHLCLRGCGRLSLNSPRHNLATHRYVAVRASTRRPLGQQTLQQDHDSGRNQCVSQHPSRSANGLPVEERGSSSPSALPVAAVAGAVAAVPLALPATASASSILAVLVPHSLQQHHMWQTVCYGCTAAGAASLLVTLVCTSRFLVSCYPSLEQQVMQQRWRLPWLAVCLFDPLLQPMRRRFFGQTEEGDLDFAAVALLAVVTCLLECMVGKDGLLNPYIPDFSLLEALQFLIIFQRGFLLPLWCIVVLRWGRLL